MPLRQDAACKDAKAGGGAEDRRAITGRGLRQRPDWLRPPPAGCARAMTAAQAGGMPKSVCLRVTRACNAACDFCLAPPDGVHVPLERVLRQVGWLASRGVR